MAVRPTFHELRMWGHMSTTDLPGPSLLAGRYRLVERLGAGGMSVVWRGFDEVLGRQVAVKVLPRANSADPSFRRRLRAEAQAAARLSHPHITNVYDYGEATPVAGAAPLPFVVMELVDGESLAAILGRVRVLPWPAAVRVCADVAAALAAAHSRGIVHRDVTPANVMITASGAKVVDFGISALIGENDIDPDGSLLGTPAYLAPERLVGGQVSPATDVYAVGLLIYRTLIGQLPWDVGTTTALLRAHQYTEPEPLPHVDGLPPSVYALVGRCLEKLPDDRPSSAELAHVLAGIAAEAPKQAPVRGPWADDEGDTTILPWQHGTADVQRAAADLHRPAAGHRADAHGAAAHGAAEAHRAPAPAAGAVYGAAAGGGVYGAQAAAAPVAGAAAVVAGAAAAASLAAGSSSTGSSSAGSAGSAAPASEYAAPLPRRGEPDSDRAGSDSAPPAAASAGSPAPGRASSAPAPHTADRDEPGRDLPADSGAAGHAVPRQSVPACVEIGAVRPAAFDQAAAGGLARAGARGVPAAKAGAVPSQRSGAPDDAAPIANAGPAAGSGAGLPPLGNGGSYGPAGSPEHGGPQANGFRAGGQNGHGAPQNGHSSPHHGPSPSNGHNAHNGRDGFPAQNSAGAGGYGGAGGASVPPPSATWPGYAAGVAAAAAQARRAAVRRRALVVTTGAVVAIGVTGYGWSAWDDADQRADGASTAVTTAPRSCFVTYAVLSDKGKKFKAGVLVTNNSPQPIDNWSLRFVMPGDQKVAGKGGFTLKQQGHDVTAASKSAIRPLRTTQLNLTGGYRQGNPVPMLFTLNGQLCEALVSRSPGAATTLVPNVPGTTVDGKGFPVPAPNAVPTFSTGPNGVVVTLTPGPSATTTAGTVITEDPGPGPVVTTTTPPPPSPPPPVQTTTTPPPPTEDEELPPPIPGDEEGSESGLFETITETIKDLT
jgi:hypothetical protein